MHSQRVPMPPACLPPQLLRLEVCRDARGNKFVLKRALHESAKLEKRLAHLHAEAEAAALSQAAAQAFNAAALHRPILGSRHTLEYNPGGAGWLAGCSGLGGREREPGGVPSRQ